jgi:hypothetical protein
VVLRRRLSYPRLYSLGVDANLIALPFKSKAPWTTHQRRKKRNKTFELLSRRYKSSKWGRGLHPPPRPRAAALESQHRPTKHATHESNNKQHVPLCKRSLSPARHALEDISHRTRPKIDAGDTQNPTRLDMAADENPVGLDLAPLEYYRATKV